MILIARYYNLTTSRPLHGKRQPDNFPPFRDTSSVLQLQSSVAPQPSSSYVVAPGCWNLYKNITGESSKKLPEMEVPFPDWWYIYTHWN